MSNFFNKTYRENKNFQEYQSLPENNTNEENITENNNNIEILTDKFVSDKWMAIIVIILVPLLGILLGLIIPPSEKIPPPYDKISSIIGWTYFSAWSISFYPQVYTNFMRKSVVGLSLDFQLLNLLGFACYSCFNCVLFWDVNVQKYYLKTHPGKSIAVQINDIFFALHAFAICVVIIIQCLIYERGNQKFSNVAIGATGIVVFGASIWTIVVFLISKSQNSDNFFSAEQILILLYVLSSVKLIVSLIKYIPQVWLNYRRKSTVGWSIGNVLLDFTGGILSFGQIFFDSAVENDWNNFTGNPVKFGLGLISIFFDVIFMLQHYVFYKNSSGVKIQAVSSENEQLL
eukprot:TRINITY_DN10383_c1_g1_i1.p1 TRINITY_DN10383_c1_g1~~TRINITY_DN10383_c1_g1_i1.p1  ORF type:complete len:378 (-),score=46.01 TRINITY_DN10383_c1_g1_i1:246-1280(-)